MVGGFRGQNFASLLPKEEQTVIKILSTFLHRSIISKTVLSLSWNSVHSNASHHRDVDQLERESGGETIIITDMENREKLKKLELFRLERRKLSGGRSLQICRSLFHEEKNQIPLCMNK